MSDSVDTAEIADLHEGAHEHLAVHIQEELTQLLKSAPFRASKQSQQLLRYIVEQTLSGNGELLKERVIGVEVFGRRADYDTSADPIVRSRATEVRRRLAQYYLGEGIHASIRIEISPGSYHATFSSQLHSGEDGHRVHAGEAESHAVSAPEETPESGAVSGRPGDDATRAEGHRNRRVYALRTAIVLLLAGLAGTLYWMNRSSAIDRFWNPLSKGAKPIYIYTGSLPIATPLVTVGDLSASVDVSAFLAQSHQKFDIRSGEDITFDDLRQFPAVLIGCLNNRWTMLVNDELQFACSIEKAPTIRERFGAHREWTSVYSTDGKIQTDYAVVDRLVSSKMGQPLIVIAGIADSGTRAAAEFVTNPQRLKELAAAAPKGWEKKNMQFVLQTKVVNNIPSTSTVVAVDCW